MDATEILLTMAHKYSTCNSYSDCGVFDSWFEEKYLGSRAFATYFVRPNKFRFETYSLSSNRSDRERFAIIWSDGQAAYERYPFGTGQIERVATLEDVVFGAIPFEPLAYDLPSLLLPEFQKYDEHLLKLQDVRKLMSTKPENDQSYLLVGSAEDELDTKLWISKKDFKLLCIEQEYFYTPEKALSSRATAGELRGNDFSDVDWPISDKTTHSVYRSSYRDVRFDEPIAAKIFSGISST